ncbi:hypothetical protein COCVIDRAFT_110022, partial [Bipolaris victoriae FI3]
VCIHSDMPRRRQEPLQSAFACRPWPSIHAQRAVSDKKRHDKTDVDGASKQP